MALRNAYQHALLAQIHPDINIPGEIFVSYERDTASEEEVVRIVNTGKQGTGKVQVGWERDVNVFKGLTQGWQVREIDGQFSKYNPAAKHWVTELSRKVTKGVKE